MSSTGFRPRRPPPPPRLRRTTTKTKRLRPSRKRSPLCERAFHIPSVICVRSNVVALPPNSKSSSSQPVPLIIPPPPLVHGGNDNPFRPQPAPPPLPPPPPPPSLPNSKSNAGEGLSFIVPQVVYVILNPPLPLFPHTTLPLLSTRGGGWVGCARGSIVDKKRETKKKLFEKAQLTGRDVKQQQGAFGEYVSSRPVTVSLLDIELYS